MVPGDTFRRVTQKRRRAGEPPNVEDFPRETLVGWMVGGGGRMRMEALRGSRREKGREISFSPSKPFLPLMSAPTVKGLSPPAGASLPASQPASEPASHGRESSSYG